MQLALTRLSFGSKKIEFGILKLQLDDHSSTLFINALKELIRAGHGGSIKPTEAGEIPSLEATMRG